MLLSALDSDREKILSAVIPNTVYFRDSAEAPRVRRRLIDIFEGDNETLKFGACWPLACAFAHQPAYDYLLEQAVAENYQRRQTALSRLGNRMMAGRPPSPSLLRTLETVLADKDRQYARSRRSAAGVLLAYRGEEVLRRAIDLLGDDDVTLVRELGRKLTRSYPDKEAARQALTQAAAEHQDQQVRKQAGQLLSQLKRTGAPRPRFGR
jgi:hypothetical protein